jgi:hypothetical protein
MQKTIAVAGTHGKTTTTSMIAAMLDAGGMDPTVINGGIINRYGSNARLGKSDWMVVEADESDGSFPEARRDDRGRHQHRSRASRALGKLRGSEARLLRVRRERPLLRTRGPVRRPPGSAEHPQPDPGPADRHLRLFRARRPSRRECRAGRDWKPVRRGRPRARRRAPHDRRESTCRSPGGTTSRTRLPRSRSASSLASRREDRHRLRAVRGRQAPLQQGRRDRRRDDHRRLCASPGRNPGGAFGGAGDHRRAGSSP